MLQELSCQWNSINVVQFHYINRVSLHYPKGIFIMLYNNNDNYGTIIELFGKELH